VLLPITASNVLADWYSQSRDLMGTRVFVEYWIETELAAEEAANAVMREMERIEAALSPHYETSELSLVNREAPKREVLITDELAYLIDKSLWYSKISDGAFDISLASVGQYYDYRKQRKPGAKQLEDLLPSVNFQAIKLDRGNNLLRFEHPQLRIDLGGIAKGYAIDRGIEILKVHGIRSAVVTAGGAVEYWVIEMDNPG